MVEPLFFAADAKLAKVGSRFSITGAEAKHASAVRRIRVSESIQVTDGEGVRAKGAVVASSSDKVEIEVSEFLVEAKPKLQITLIQALAKGDRDELAVQAATELGAVRIMPWQASRSVSKWEGAKVAKGVQRWQTIVDEASKQALQVWFPKVLEPVNSKQLKSLVQDEEFTIVLDPLAPTGISDLPFKDARAINLVVGPEGGIAPDELEAFEAAGAKRVRLGSNILRTSTAGIAAMSAILALQGQWQHPNTLETEAN